MDSLSQLIGNTRQPDALAQDVQKAMDAVLVARGNHTKMQVYVTSKGVRALTPEEAKADATAKRVGIPALQAAFEETFAPALGQERAREFAKTLDQLSGYFIGTVAVRTFGGTAHTDIDAVDLSDEVGKAKGKAVSMANLISADNQPVIEVEDLERAWNLHSKVGFGRCWKSWTANNEAGLKEIMNADADACQAVVDTFGLVEGRDDDAIDYFDWLIEGIRESPELVRSRFEKFIPFYNDCFHSALMSVTDKVRSGELPADEAYEALQEAVFNDIEAHQETGGDPQDQESLDMITRDEFRRIAGIGIELEVEEDEVPMPKLDFSHPSQMRLIHDYQSGAWGNADLRNYRTRRVPDSYTSRPGKDDESSHLEELLAITLMDEGATRQALEIYFQQIAPEEV